MKACTVSFGVCAWACDEDDGPWRAAIKESLTARRKPEKPLPGALQQAANLAKAVVKVGCRAAKGGKLCRSEAEKAKVRAICKTCPGGFWRESDKRCSECGCFGAFKTILDTEECPKGYWKQP